MPNMPYRYLTRMGFKTIISAAAIITAISTIYVSLFSPDTNLLRFLGTTAVILAIVAFSLAIFVLKIARQNLTAYGHGFIRRVAFFRKNGVVVFGRLLFLGLVLIICSAALFVADYYLTPKTSKVNLSQVNRELLLINGSAFGSDTSQVVVRFVGAIAEEQVAQKVNKNQLEVAIPEKFSRGTIFVRRGPRISSPVSFVPPGIVYEIAIVRLFQQSEDAIASPEEEFEPYPGFPYYSELSDKPTEWPPRVFKDRTQFHVEIGKAFSGIAA